MSVTALTNGNFCRLKKENPDRSRGFFEKDSREY
jgi:hypothetical protein